VFGLGGLMRFRTEAATTRDTSSLIIVTLIGLICGLNLPHFAVLATLYAWVILLFDGNPIYSLEVHEIPKGRMADASAAYRAGLSGAGCRLISENKSFSKRRLTYIIRAKSGQGPESLESALNGKIAADIRGELDWQVR